MTPLQQALRPFGFRPAPAGGEASNYATSDHSQVLDVLQGPGGMREFRAALVQLAARAREIPSARGILLVHHVRMSPAGLRAEWERVRGVLDQTISARLRLVLVIGEHVEVVPPDPELEALGKALAASGASTASEGRVDRSFEVMRVLISRWLLHRGPIAVGELQRQTGLSHPSVSKALAALGPAVERRHDRSVALRAFPSEAWAQLVALAPKVRQTAAFLDESGRGGDAHRLLDRLRRAPPSGVAAAGVIAARHWHPGLDLEGLPRLDLSVHAPNGGIDTAFVAQLDPALVPVPSGTPPLLVLHAVPRAESLFVAGGDGLPWADPVEVLLDLYELRLIEQADDLVRALRRTS